MPLRGTLGSYEICAQSQIYETVPSPLSPEPNLTSPHSSAFKSNLRAQLPRLFLPFHQDPTFWEKVSCPGKGQPSLAWVVEVLCLVPGNAWMRPSDWAWRFSDVTLTILKRLRLAALAGTSSPVTSLSVCRLESTARFNPLSI